LKAEHWALIISFLALTSSIVLPIWFRMQESKEKKEKKENKRASLLQKILTLKSLTNTSKHELMHLIQKHGSKMEDDQLTALKAQSLKL